MKSFCINHSALRWLLSLGLCGGSLTAAEPQGLSEEASRQIKASQDEKATRTPAQKKMDSQLIHAARIARGEAIAGAPRLQPALKMLGDGRVLVDIDATVSEALLAEIKAGGGKVTVSVPALKSIRALVTPQLAERLAGRPDVRFVRPAAEAMTNAGSVNSEGDVAHQANLVRTRLNFAGTGNANGTGVKIGVLSDSVRFLAASQASNDLGPVTVLAGQDGLLTPPTDTGEGTAMLEIVHDLAPGAELYFATGSSSPASMAQNILNLRAEGCHIIIDDVTYFNEPPFQDGVIARAVNDVCDGGALYFSSAGNSGNLNDGTSGTWEGDFVDGGTSPLLGNARLHNFGGGATFNTVTAVGSTRGVDLFWADPLEASSNDYDLYILDAAGANILRQSTNSQSGTQDAYEAIGGLNVGERIVVVRFSGAGRFLHLDTGRCRIAIGTAGKVRGHNAAGAANAFSVAATNAAALTVPFPGGAFNPVETFSSDGPRRMFFDRNGTPFTPGNFSSTGGIVLQKPDITAADNVVTSVPGFAAFSGTSAAAPHAGAIAALLLSFNPNFTPAQIRAALQSSALDIEAAGFDRDSGVGIVMAFPAFQALLAPEIWVDFALANDNGVGTFAQPYKTMRRATSNVRDGGNVWLKAPRSTPETIVIEKSMLIQSVGGCRDDR